MIKKKLGIINVIIFYSVILAIVSGFQIFGKNPDYNVYEQIFGNYIERPSMEPVFSLFRYVNDKLFDSSLISVFFLFSFFSIQIKSIVIYKLAENTICFLFSLSYYFITFFLIHEYTQIRAACAIAVYFLSLLDLKNDRIFRFYVKAAVAVLFHYSAILMFIFPFFINFFYTRKRLLIVMLVGIVFAFICDTLLGQRLQNYIFFIEKILYFNKLGNVSDFMKPWNLKYAVLTLVCLSILLLIDLDRNNLILMQSCVFGICFFYYLNPVHLPVISVRLAEFYTSVVVVLFVNAIWYIRIKEKTILLLFIGIFFILYSKATLNTLHLF